MRLLFRFAVLLWMDSDSALKAYEIHNKIPARYRAMDVLARSRFSCKYSYYEQVWWNCKPDKDLANKVMYLTDGRWPIETEKEE